MMDNTTMWPDGKDRYNPFGVLSYLKIIGLLIVEVNHADSG
jgi:hypothetical protein